MSISFVEKYDCASKGEGAPSIHVVGGGPVEGGDVDHPLKYPKIERRATREQRLELSECRKFMRVDLPPEAHPDIDRSWAPSGVLECGFRRSRPGFAG